MVLSSRASRGTAGHGPPRSSTSRSLALLALASLAVGGCGSETGSEARAGEGPTSASRTLDAPPDLRVGEWWQVEVHPELLDAPYHTTLVVAERSDEGAVIGIPPSDFSHDLLVLHVPPLGDLDLESFAWRVMWDDFEALRFPLEEGRTWEADFHGNDVEAEVVRVEDGRAWVTMVGEGERIELVYDAAAGMITEFREEALGLAFRVTDHGFGYTGEVLRPTGIELGIMQPGPAATSGHHGGEPAGSSAEVEVDTGHSHGSLSLVLWNVGAEGEPGSYRITATAPDGTTFEETFEVGTDAPSLALTSFGHDAVNGAWELAFERDGPGRLLVELFTYDLTTVRLEGGASDGG